jgi:hypothetical protein
MPDDSTGDERRQTATADPPPHRRAQPGEERAGSEGVDGGRRETDKERRDRELIELLNELRLSAPGVQVTFGFLLIVPFQGRFDDTSDFERAVYGISLMFVAVAAILILSTAVQHRVLFRRHFERRLLITASYTSLAGMTCLGLGLLGSVLFVTHFLWGTALAALCTTIVGVGLVTIWYLVPLGHLLHRDP